MRGWLRRTWRRLRDEPPRRALRASGYEAAAGTIGRAASGVYGQFADPTPIWDRDWDVCCVLDGCRVDLLRTVANDGDYEYLQEPSVVEALWSVGSQSAEWMAETFASEYRAAMARTAYVSGNPFTAQSGEQIDAVETEPLPLTDADFGWLYEAWRDEWIHDDISTIPPEPLTDAAIAAWRRRDELDVDRVIVHYMQPHTPFRSRPDWFLGSADIEDWGQLDDGDDADGDGNAAEGSNGDGDGAEELNWADLDEETLELLEALDGDGEVGRDPWTRLRDGELPAAEFWAAYRDNLAWVLDDVARLVENCDGRIALTSDHGNAAGEFGVWSHPPAVYVPALRQVPWVDIDGRDRGTHEPGLPHQEGERAGAGRAAERRLVDLGYR